MRKVTICFLMMLCSAYVFGQQQPQWKTIASVLLFNQTAGIPQTGIFTPTEPGIYRLNSYLSGGNVVAHDRGNGYALTIAGFDITGLPFGNTNICCDLSINCNGAGYAFNAPIIVSLKPDVPVVYQVFNHNGFGCVYNLAITVEQLLPPSSSISFAGTSPMTEH